MQRVSLVQDGPVFLPIFAASDGSTVDWEATITKVTMISPTEADVHYALRPDGQTALPGQTGVAVLVNGRWLVSTATICTLMANSDPGARSELPTVCQTPSGLAG